MRALEKLNRVDKLFDRSGFKSLNSSIRKLNSNLFSFFENLLERIDSFFNAFVSSVITHGQAETNLECKDYN